MVDTRKSSLREGTTSGKPLLHKHKQRDSNLPSVDDFEHEDNLDRGRSQHNGYAGIPDRQSSPRLSTASSRPMSRHSQASGSGAGTPQHPSFSRRSTLRSRSPSTNARLAARKKYTYAAIFLILALVSFCVQTELGAYVQNELGWNKAYCMLYLTHGELDHTKRDMPWSVFWSKHVWLCRTTAQMVEGRTLEVPHHHSARSPVRYMLTTTAVVTSALTVAGLGWYIAVDMTTPDLTAIYNCSAFFAYVFSVPLLKEPLRLDKSFAVIIAIIGVLIVAYGDSKPTDEEADANNRFLGNLIIGVGSVLYGLYEVLYKRYACPPEGCSPGRGMVFANLVGSLIGTFTLSVLWFPLPILHMLGIEKFALPTGATAFWLFVSVVMNATFAGSFLVLISLTSPVLSSVASLLTIFIVALSDWFLTGEPLSFAAIVGGIMIIAAFLMLSVSTWREIQEEEKRKSVEFDEADLEPDEDDDDESDKASLVSHHG
ncbi:hypothetical protein INS49_012857 [Diaporthe citri]|uniref:uncharacterized protein n=1 Tax=Diaporthe citri TaxID=83186 RepID=UPI001C7F7609|nr:uncharacterized protein INS49_012857 [Diaporthe citri]KAG6359336.1 hypothetical protein INS49_012857 [Diaporthe citri]